MWYLTRPMRDDEEPETHTFQQSSEFGVFEGTVTIVESVVKEKTHHDYLCFRKTIGQNHISDSAIRRYRRGHCGADLPDGEIHR